MRQMGELEPVPCPRPMHSPRKTSPLFWAHVNPYGKFRLDMDRHLDLDLPSVA